MEGAVMAEVFGSDTRLANREFVKTTSPDKDEARSREHKTFDFVVLGSDSSTETSSDSSPDKEGACRREHDPFDLVGSSSETSPETSPDKEEARRRERNPFDFFDLLDMLADEGGLGDVEDLEGGSGSKARAVVVTKKHPVGCRQRNVVRPQKLLPSIYHHLLPAESHALHDRIEKLLNKNAADAELRRLECLKTATF